SFFEPQSPKHRTRRREGAQRSLLLLFSLAIFFGMARRGKERKSKSNFQIFLISFSPFLCAIKFLCVLRPSRLCVKLRTAISSTHGQDTLNRLRRQTHGHCSNRSTEDHCHGFMHV